MLWFPGEMEKLNHETVDVNYNHLFLKLPSDLRMCVCEFFISVLLFYLAELASLFFFHRGDLFPRVRKMCPATVPPCSGRSWHMTFMLQTWLKAVEFRSDPLVWDNRQSDGTYRPSRWFFICGPDHICIFSTKRM